MFNLMYVFYYQTYDIIARMKGEEKLKKVPFTARQLFFIDYAHVSVPRNNAVLRSVRSMELIELIKTKADIFQPN